MSLQGKKPARIEAVRVLGLTGPIEFLGVHTMLLPQENGTFSGTEEFPPPDWPTKSLKAQQMVPVPVTRTPSGEAEEALQIVVGIRVTGPGIARYRGVEVTYEVGDSRYREVYETPVYLCAPKTAFADAVASCPGDAEDVFDDRSAVATA